MRYDSRVEECCLVGFRASRKALKALSVLAASNGEKTLKRVQWDELNCASFIL
jgi:hypothetical protein